MARWIIAVVVVVLAVASHVAPLSGPHIADVNILLPPKMTHPVEYRLLGSGGCFKWSWDHHDILSVVPEYNSSNRCSTSARLRSIHPYNGRKETAVYATDMHTGMLIRCKVYIDIFSRIQIFHNSIKLDLDGLATLRVRAFDAEDNVFSSLVGLQFMWKLIPEANGLPHHLVHVPLRDSPLSDCGGLCGDLDIQITLEDGGVFSDLYVVQGVGIGHQTVSVHLHESQVDHMADKIVLTVAEAMSLDPPSPVLVLIGAIVQYTLKVIRGNIPQVVTLPSTYHRWSASNSSVAQVDMMMGFAHALRLGVSSVIVEDTRVAGHSQISSLHVVLPDTMHLYLLPLSQTGEAGDEMNPISRVSRWYIVSGRSYLVLIKVYARGLGAREIYITETDDIKLHDDQSGRWNILSPADNADLKHGSINSRILEATSYGLGKLLATLTYSTGDDAMKEVLKVVEEVMVCNQVRFTMNYQNLSTKSILLPWAPTVYQELDLKATGGCAKVSTDYKWFSSDRAIISVSAYGIVQAKKTGKATIKVVSIFDPLNYDEVVVEVSIPSSMVMLPNFPVETIVGSHLQAAVTMKTSNGAFFDRCDAFSSFTKWEVGSESFKIINVTRESFSFDMQYGPPCAWTNVYASAFGGTMLNAILSIEHHPFDHSLSEAIVLKVSSRIAAHTPLVISQAGDGNQFGGYWFDLAQTELSDEFEILDELYLVPGSHLDIILRGGPSRWSERVQFIEDVEILSEENTSLRSGAAAHQSSTSHVVFYRISCNKLGAYTIAFKRGNLIGDDHPLPAVAEVQLLLRCSFPSAMVLIADEAVNRHEVILRSAKAARGPDRVHVNPITVANGRTIRISAIGISSSGKAFGNSSSLKLSWELINCDSLASWDNDYVSTTLKSSWERFLVLHDVSGLCIVRASVIGFSRNVDVDHSTLLLESLNSNLTDAVRLQLVSTLRVEPEFSLLFFSPDAQLNLSIIGGSCSLDTVVNNSEVVQVLQPRSSLQCFQLTLIPKGLGTTLVTVYDIGISPPLAATSVVQVSDLDWIRITSPEELSIMEGSLHPIDLVVGVDGGNTFHFSQYVYMSIRVHIEDRTVELAESENVASPINGFVKGPNFVIRAKTMGITTLYVSARQHSGREIRSQSIKVEVYAMPRLHPSDIFLVPGASYMLTLIGGPTIGAHVEYGSMDVETAIVHISSGRLSAVSPGNTTVVAILYGRGETVICQAISQVKVGIPSSAMLITQSDQLAVNHEMPIFPSFSEGNLFSFYELCKNYKWITENDEVLSLQNRGPMPDVKHAVAMFYGDENDFSYLEVIHGKSAGMTKVTVSFSCDFNYSGSFYQSTAYIASTTLSVVSELPLALGASMTWTLPPHYTSSNLLPMSSSPYSQYNILNRKGVISYSLLAQCGRTNEEVQNHAISLERDRIRTVESNNIACIQAKDGSTGRIEVAACIRVAEVSQIRTSNNNLQRVDLAIGAELDLPIHYYDVLGIPFLEAYDVPFDVEINYPDIVHINVSTHGNGSIRLKALKYGRALMRLSFSNSEQKSDYMLITVGAHVYPQNPILQRGSRLNFSVEGSGDQVFGQWLTANESVIFVDMITGKSEAIGEGTAQVVFESSSLKLHTTVTVQNSGFIVVDAPKETLTNVPYSVKGYSFAVNFRKHNQEYEASRNDVQVLYDCSVDPHFIGYTMPWKDLETGKLYCLFFPYTPEHLARVIPKSKDMRRKIYVSVKASLIEADHISGSASALFIGGFSILDMDKRYMQLNLTEDYFIHNLTIVGNTDVKVEWEKHDRLAINLIKREDFGVGERAVYEFKVPNALERTYIYSAGRAKDFEDKVIFILPATGQREEIKFQFTVHYPLIWHVKMISLLAFFIWCFGACNYYTFKYLKKHRHWPFRVDGANRINPGTIDPLVATPSTPVRGSPQGGGVEEQYHRTPPPFMEYVMSTIDETPNYYRGETRRRRVHPQNSF